MGINATSNDSLLSAAVQKVLSQTQEIKKNLNKPNETNDDNKTKNLENIEEKYNESDKKMGVAITKTENDETNTPTSNVSETKKDVTLQNETREPDMSSDENQDDSDLDIDTSQKITRQHKSIALKTKNTVSIDNAINSSGDNDAQLVDAYNMATSDENVDLFENVQKNGQNIYAHAAYEISSNKSKDDEGDVTCNTNAYTIDAGYSYDKTNQDGSENHFRSFFSYSKTYDSGTTKSKAAPNNNQDENVVNNTTEQDELNEEKFNDKSDDFHGFAAYRHVFKSGDILDASARFFKDGSMSATKIISTGSYTVTNLSDSFNVQAKIDSTNYINKKDPYNLNHNNSNTKNNKTNLFNIELNLLPKNKSANDVDSNTDDTETKEPVLDENTQETQSNNTSETQTSENTFILNKWYRTFYPTLSTQTINKNVEQGLGVVGRFFKQTDDSVMRIGIAGKGFMLVQPKDENNLAINYAGMIAANFNYEKNLGNGNIDIRGKIANKYNFSARENTFTSNLSASYSSNKIAAEIEGIYINGKDLKYTGFNGRIVYMPNEYIETYAEGSYVNSQQENSHLKGLGMQIGFIANF